MCGVRLLQFDKSRLDDDCFIQTQCLFVHSNDELEFLICVFIAFLSSDDGNEGTITWDDRSVNDLLDRTKEGIEQKDMADDYLNSFKVASYVIKEEEEEEEEVR